MALLNIFTVWGQKETLKFNQNRTFKIVQFTDVHYKYDDQVNSQVALDRMNEVLDIEKPEFVIFTGDVVVSNESFKGLDIVLDVCIKRNIPFAVVFGNHDDEYDHTRPELYDYIAKKKGSLMPTRISEVVPDYVLTVKSSKDKNKDAALLYCIDSHSYTQIKSVPGYDWIKFNQIYNPQIQISVVSGTKRSIFRQKNKTKRSKKRLHTTLIKPEQKVNEDLCSGFIVS